MIIIAFLITIIKIDLYFLNIFNISDFYHHFKNFQHIVTYFGNELAEF